MNRWAVLFLGLLYALGLIAGWNVLGEPPLDTDDPTWLASADLLAGHQLCDGDLESPEDLSWNAALPPVEDFLGRHLKSDKEPGERVAREDVTVTPDLHPKEPGGAVFLYALEETELVLAVALEVGSLVRPCLAGAATSNGDDSGQRDGSQVCMTAALEVLALHSATSDADLSWVAVSVPASEMQELARFAAADDSFLLVVGRNPAASVQAGVVRLLVATELGDFELELDAARAPATVANFLRYVDAGRYEGGRFHRTVTLENQVRDDVLIEVIQAGPNPDAGENFDPIPLERTRDTGLAHVDGTVSMARGGPDTATGDFFICIGAQPSLDFGGDRNADGQGFAAFGQVASGMEVVRLIHQSPADERERLQSPITITRISRLR